MMQVLRGWRSYSRCGAPPPLRRRDGFSVKARNQRPGRIDHWRLASSSSSNGHGGGDDKESSGRKPLLLLPRLIPRRSSFSSWARWLIGSALALLIPLWKKGSPALLRIEEEVEKVADAAEVAAEVVEQIAGVVEKVADAAEVAAEVVEQIAGVVEKVSSEVAEKLPEESKLKDAVLLVEQVSKEAAGEAQAARDIIHKVNEVKQEVEKTLDAGKEDHRR